MSSSHRQENCCDHWYVSRLLCQAAGNASSMACIPIFCALESDKAIAAGATGLIGSRLAARLSSQGHTVRVLTRNVNKARNKLQYARLQFYSTQQLQEAVRGADAVINLAGQSFNLQSVAYSCNCAAIAMCCGVLCSIKRSFGLLLQSLC